jgi:nicotinamide/nicotinate riboside kinase
MTLGPNITTVAVSGPSSSGKSSVVDLIHQYINRYTVNKSVIVHLDDYYIPDDEIPIDAETGEQNWDCPESIDYDKCIKDIQLLKRNEKITTVSIEPKLKFDVCGDDKEELIHKLNQIPANNLIILVDGFMLFHDRKMFENFDVKLFIYSSYSTLKTRREARSGYVTQQGFWVDPPKYFDKIVWKEFIRNHKSLFVDENCENDLTSEAKSMGIIAKLNENMTIIDLTNWAIDQIIDNIT